MFGWLKFLFSTKSDPLPPVRKSRGIDMSEINKELAKNPPRRVLNKTKARETIRKNPPIDEPSVWTPAPNFTSTDSYSSDSSSSSSIDTSSVDLGGGDCGGGGASGDCD